MVKLHVKKRDESQFLYETTTVTSIRKLVRVLVSIYNGRLKIQRLCKEMEELSKYGISIPPSSEDEQLEHNMRNDDWSKTCIPNGGYVENKDPNCRRIGKAPTEKMAVLLTKVTAEATCGISEECIAAEVCLTQLKITELLETLKNALVVVYPMGLPSYDPIQQELENCEEKTAAVISLETAQLWWAGKQLEPNKRLSDYTGKNEKTKIVVKLQESGQGPPSREPLMGAEEQKQLMLCAYRRQEELKHLEEDDDDEYFNAQWADKLTLKRSSHGVQHVNWKPH